MYKKEKDERPVAVITGASSGIGMATALRFADQGYNVVLAARRQKELSDIAAACEQRGVHALAISTDVSDEKQVAKLGDRAVNTFGKIDVWVNAAGVYLAGKFSDIPLADMQQVMQTNFFGTIYGSQRALRTFRDQKFGTLINLSSVNAPAPQPFVGVYSASKAAIRALDDSLRMELKLNKLEDTVHVCSVLPASTDTNLFQNAANYTGKTLQAATPVYEPTFVAKHIVRLAKHPKREVIIGQAGTLLALENAHLPRFYEKYIAKFTQRDLLTDEAAVSTSGNLYSPVGTNTGVHGGWRQERLRGDRANAAGAGISLALLGAAGLSFAVLRRKQSKGMLHLLTK